jgi:LPS export ABC transporter permease LptG
VRTLSRQFLASFLSLYVAILFVSVLVIAIVELMLNLDDIVELGGGFTIAQYLFLRLPTYYLPYLVPFASFGAAFLCMGLPARASELVAIKAGGVAPWQVARPVLLAAVVLSLLTGIASETVVRDAARALERLESGGEDAELFQARGSFWYHRGRFLYSVEAADRATRTLRGVLVLERDRDGQLLQRIEADSALISDDHQWELRDAIVRHFDPSDPSAPPQTLRVATTTLAVGSERDLALLDADASRLSLLDLHAYVDALAQDGRNPNRYRAMLHARLAEPLSVLLFTLIGIPLGLMVERSKSLAVAGVQGIAVLGLFYAARTTAAMIAATGVAATVHGPWLVLSAFGGYAVWRLLRVPL